MDLTPWNPLKDLGSLRKEMDGLLKRFVGESPFAGSMSGGWLPSIDVTEGPDSISVKAELPGLESADIDVSIMGDLLTIKGEKKKEEVKEDEKSHYSERYYGSFERSLRIPCAVQTDEIKAVFDKGVLSITLPKTEETKSKTVKISVE